MNDAAASGEASSRHQNDEAIVMSGDIAALAESTSPLLQAPLECALAVLELRSQSPEHGRGTITHPAVGLQRMLEPLPQRSKIADRSDAALQPGKTPGRRADGPLTASGL